MLIKVLLRSRSAHFGTAFSNHSSKGSHRIPSKSAMKGMLGASMGLDLGDALDLDVRFSFRWVTDVTSMMITKKQMMLKYGVDVKTVLRSKDWKRGEFSTALDSVEYLYGDEGLKAEWFVEVNEGESDKVMESLLNPEYPLYLGKSECLVYVEDVEKMDITPKEPEERVFEDLFIGESKGYVMKERMVEKMKGYRRPETLRDVCTGGLEIRGVPDECYYEINGEALCMW